MTTFEKMSALWRLFDPKMKRQALFLIGLLLVGSLLEATGVSIIFPLFHAVSSPDKINDYPVLVFGYELLGKPSYSIFLGVLSFLVVVFFLLKNLYLIMTIYYRNRFIMQNQAVMANRLLDSYLRRPYSFHLQANSSGLLRNITQSVSQLFSGTAFPLLIIMTELFVAIAIVSVLVVAEPVAAITVGLVLAVPMVFITSILRRPLKAWGQKAHELWQETLLVINHALFSIRDIQILNREKYFLDKHLEIARASARMAEKASLSQEIPRIVTELLAMCALLSLVLVVLNSSRSAEELLPIMGLFGAAAIRLMPSVSRISAQVNSISFSTAAFQQIDHDLRLSEALGSQRTAVRTPQQLYQTLQLTNVSYKYETADGIALDNVSLEVKSGESIALAGPSGAGKSTFINVILGLLRPDSGQILIDGQEVTDRMGEFALDIGYVPQDAILIDDTIARNIAFGLPDEEIDENKLWAAIEKAQLQSVISNLPEGIYTTVGERGVQLSGGQRQRIAIARALFNDPHVLVLDEATSSLDAETEFAISEAIEALRGEKTLISIAHRLSTIKNCDRIYWLESGKISDCGTFSSLVNKNAAFKSMVDQMSLAIAPKENAVIVKNLEV
jgi:ATP-binding cassette, subfamily B, bacterial PglK